MSTQKNTIVAIDPGASGGIALYAKGTIKMTAKMPSSTMEMQKTFMYIKSTYENVIVYVEKVQAYGKADDDPGKKFGINKMLKNYNQLITVIELCGLKYVEVHPVSWQSTLGLRFKNTEKLPQHKFKTFRKNKYKDYAENIFPEVKVTMATSDALCIVQFVLVKIASDIQWIRERIKNDGKQKLFD